MRKSASTCLGLGLLLLGAAAFVHGQPIIVDHRHTDLSKVPAQWIKSAKSGLRIAYQHTSHGSQLVTGLQALGSALGNPYNFAATGSGYNAGVFLNDYGIDGASDLGNPNFTDWYDATRALLNRSGGCDRNVVMWSWCGQVSEATSQDIDTYLALMNQLETEFSNVRFVYITGHLDGTGVAGNLNQRNEQIRAYCRAHNKILFDFADIESYDPDHNYFLDKGASDACAYGGGNWAQQWLAARPGSDLAAIAAVCGSCAHSETLNCVLKARALCWLWARLAGWPGGDAGPAPGDLDGDGRNEAVVDFGSDGAWLWDAGAWTALTSSDPDRLVTADLDGNGVRELVADMGYKGLWLWTGAWNQLSPVNPESFAVGDTDADGRDEIVGDFGKSGLWLWNDGAWSQLSGLDPAFLTVGPVGTSGSAAIIGGFGEAGLWLRSGGAWTELSGVEPEAAVAADTDGDGAGELVGDFGPTGLWLWKAGAWSQISGLNPDFVSTADVDGAGGREIVGGFGSLGLWLWKAGIWTQLSGARPEALASGDVDGNGRQELMTDFGALGLWVWNGSSWNQASGVNPESLAAADIDADGRDELLADFGTLGLWLRDGSVWSLLSSNDPE